MDSHFFPLWTGCALLEVFALTHLVVAQGLPDVATISIVQGQSTLSTRMLHNHLSFALNGGIISRLAKGMIARS